MLRKLRKAQSTAEYAILLSLVVAAAMGIQAEVKRAIQARIHDAAMVLSNNQEYEPTTGIKTTTEQSQNRVRTENYVTAGSDEPWITTTDTSTAVWTSQESK
ncbi:MAG: hypothetical protein M0R48_03825 [Candidatus Omnitrophica bacterium]|jgi:hypothetical protein|nr:hypothetical protein [Candidatus Omnitrophota bacterium]